LGFAQHELSACHTSERLWVEPLVRHELAR
jgi:hypothetical protein